MPTAQYEILRYFDNAHLPPKQQEISQDFFRLAHDLASHLPQGPEVSAGLRKLLEAKDCFVRASL